MYVQESRRVTLFLTIARNERVKTDAPSVAGHFNYFAGARAHYGNRGKAPKLCCPRIVPMVARHTRPRALTDGGAVRVSPTILKRAHALRAY